MKLRLCLLIWLSAGQVALAETPERLEVSVLSIFSPERMEISSAGSGRLSIEIHREDGAREVRRAAAVSLRCGAKTAPLLVRPVGSAYHQGLFLNRDQDGHRIVRVVQAHQVDPEADTQRSSSSNW